MTDHPLDRIVRALSSVGSRRQALAALGALALARAHPASAASQIEISACGEAGAVCTPLKGCCSGLVCATSAINPAYGVCVSGEGELLPVSDDLVVPGAEGIEAALAQQVSAAATGTTDVTSPRVKQGAEKASKSSKSSRTDADPLSTSTGSTSPGTTTNTRHSDRATKRAARQTKRTERELNQEPRLELKLTTNDLSESEPEILRVHNRADVSVVISRVASLRDSDVFSTETNTIPAGETHLLLSGRAATEAQQSLPDSSVWWKKEVFPAVPANGDGIALTVAYSGATRTHTLEVLCDEAPSTKSAAAARRQSGQKPQQPRRDQHRSRRGKGGKG
jgi:hypothetical protein